MTEQDKAVFKIMIHGKIEDVWHEITKRDEVQKCMFNMRLDSTLEVGDKMFMRTVNGKYTGVVGEVLEFDPPNRYAHTFRFTNFDDPPCTVTYDLKAIDDQVEFIMTIDQLTPGTKSAKQMRQGGTMIIETLKSIVETGKVPFKVRMLYGLFALMGPLTPAKCKSDRWT